MVEQYAIPKYLLEVYKTDEENFEQYTPIGGTPPEDSEDELDNNESFTLHQGEIEEIYFYNELGELSWNSDYEELSNNGSITIPYHLTKLDQIYLGVRILLRQDWEEYGESKLLKELPEVLLGFITDESFNNGMTNIELSGMSKLLEQKYEFNFTQMKRSEILEEMIKTAGLVPDVDFEGLPDEIIDYNNTTNDGGNETTGSVDTDVKSLVKKITKGLKKKLAKAKAIYNWAIENLSYTNYSCSRQSTASGCLKSKKLNCADTSRLIRAMLTAANIESKVVHGPNHFWTIAIIDGVEYALDPTSKSRQFNTTWKNMSYYSVCGSEPSC